MSVRAPKESFLGGAQKALVAPEFVERDQVLHGIYGKQNPYKIKPVGDPLCDSIGQYMAETPNRMHALERVLRADMGDPELNAIDLPPYFRAHPKMLSMAAFPGIAEMVLHNRKGLVIVGNVAFRNPAEQISIGGICNLNPQLMNVVPSSIATPIPTMIFSVKQLPLSRAVAQAAPGSSTAKALEAIEQLEMPEPGRQRQFEVTMNTGQKITVSGAEYAEQAKIRAMTAAREAGTGTRAVKVEEIPGTEQPEDLAGEYLMPVRGGRISSGYGDRINPISGLPKFHKGIDIAAPEGSTVSAISPGIVTESKTSSSYGNYIIVRHDNGQESLYAHLSQRAVGEGQRVTAGQRIGEVGHTGHATGPHLHLEIHDTATGETVNPAELL